MNSIDLCIIVIFLIIVFEGYARGFIASLLSLVRFAVGIPISFIVADKFSSVVYTFCSNPCCILYFNRYFIVCY